MGTVTPPKKELVSQIGRLGSSLFDNLGDAWLRLDGATEYRRAAYPEFVVMASGKSWFLAGSTSDKFKLMKAPAGTAIASSGFDSATGQMIGSDKVTLTIDNLPAHSHGYKDNQATPASAKGGLLAGILTILNGVTSADVTRTTDAAGKAVPDPVPIKPPAVTANLFVYAGRPRA